MPLAYFGHIHTLLTFQVADEKFSFTGCPPNGFSCGQQRPPAVWHGFHLRVFGRSVRWFFHYFQRHDRRVTEIAVRILGRPDPFTCTQVHQNKMALGTDNVIIVTPAVMPHIGGEQYLWMNVPHNTLRRVIAFPLMVYAGRQPMQLPPRHAIS